MADSTEIRRRLVDLLRRDLVGPGPDDADLARERLRHPEKPSRWYLTGFLAPAGDEPPADDPSIQEELDTGDDIDPEIGMGGAAGDDDGADNAAAKRRFLPSSLGLTVLLPPTAGTIEVAVDWGDYVTEPPLPAGVLLGEGDGADSSGKPQVDWVRVPRQATAVLDVTQAFPSPHTLADSGPAAMTGGALQLKLHQRLFRYRLPDGGEQQARAVTVFLVNRRAAASQTFGDVAYAFQARLELCCQDGFLAQRDLSGYAAADDDQRLADLHYRDVAAFAVGRNVAAVWRADDDGAVRRVASEPLPIAEVERVAPNEEIAGVEFGMEALGAAAAENDGAALSAALAGLPRLYGAWIAGERDKAAALTAPRRREAADRLVAAMAGAEARIADGIGLLAGDDRARLAFRMMNEAVARAARRRFAGPAGDPAAQSRPAWRPFQLAFILLNLRALIDKASADREIVDLLFFPTGGGKTEAYLGLAAFAIAHRRLSAGGLLGAGVAVIMRYTLRLLTLDQLGRAAGVICALELMRHEAAYVGPGGRRLLGDWPIEIGLWVGSDASPNALGGKGKTGAEFAVTRVRQFRQKGGKAPAPIKSCPWCGTPFGRESFHCVPNDIAPVNMVIRCANIRCDFSGDRALPVVTVDEPIYRRLPAFLVATVDKFAGLPWIGQAGAFFGHVDRHQEGIGFFGAAESGGQWLHNGWTLDPPDLIIQDELHLISGPLGTVAALYEIAVDRLSTRERGGVRIRPKIVASTATVRRAAGQIRALFDRAETAIFPPPGIDRTDSFFARTINDADNPPRWYLGLAAQGRGPKLVFLRALTTLLAAAQAQFDAEGGGGANPADPYMTALCYFNALRELGGARRIAEDEVRERVGRYGTSRQRVHPVDKPFADRRIRIPLELTSRVSTDDVAAAKGRLESPFGGGDDQVVDVALATNMISVGLDITRLGLMLVQGQPKTAAEYIQATSRVGRDRRKPGLVVAILNLHKPRDRMHYEQFRQFHDSFYRAVEATSVTPWAARALDRALAAVVVATARHLDPALSPEQAVTQLARQEATRRQVRDAILARAPVDAVVGGPPALAAAIDALLDGWLETVATFAQGGTSFAYGRGARRLLHQPLDPELAVLPPAHRQFVAGRSMRDVEPGVLLKLRDPHGRTALADES